MLCVYCESKAIIKIPSTMLPSCKDCFFAQIESRVLKTIKQNSKLSTPGSKIAIAVSGGKDSTVLAEIISLLNKQHSLGLDLCLLSIDEGITGYRDDSLEVVKHNRKSYGIPLKIVSYKELYGWTMDEIVKEIGMKNNCTYCGVLRRQALDRGARYLGVDLIVTGHNADDLAETVLMNLSRGDFSRLIRCLDDSDGGISGLGRVKPFKYIYEKEIVMYAYFKKLEYFSTECIYSPNAYRGYARIFLKDLETIRPCSILDIIHSGEQYAQKACAQISNTQISNTQISNTQISNTQISNTQISNTQISNTQISSSQISSDIKIQDIDSKTQASKSIGECRRCGYMASQDLCKACVLLQGLNKNKQTLKGSSKIVEYDLTPSIQRFQDIKISGLAGPTLKPSSY